MQACSFPRGGTVAAPRRSREGLRIAHAPALRLAFAVSVLSASALACNDTEVDDRHRTPPAAPTTPTPPPQPEPEAPPVRKDGTIFGESELMGTRVTINVWLDPRRDAAEAGAAMNAALAEMARIEEIMSEWRSTSELSQLNARAGGAPMAVSPELFEVLSASRRIAEETGGAFDPTFHGVGQLWSFQQGARPPSRQTVAEKLPLVDWRELHVDDTARTVRLGKPGMMLGLGAIAKGYAVDRASAVLAQAGFTNHVVEAGGDTYAAGTKGGKKWNVGVQKPGERGVVGIIPASDEAIVTSGDYQRFFEHEGRRYGHILDPRTGWPLEHDASPRSVTLVASNATDADAYCTAVTVMGATEGMAFVERHPRLEAVIIDHDGTLLVSSGLKDRLVRTP